ncbi:MAG: hypothetical protein H6Q71_1470 [Firmicutes bacterium]|nr:hypothetical protein [Bacillota bacterium]
MIFPCKTQANLYKYAQNKIVMEICKRNLTPSQIPRPLRIKNTNNWLCYCPCETVKVGD